MKKRGKNRFFNNSKNLFVALLVALGVVIILSFLLAMTNFLIGLLFIPLIAIGLIIWGITYAVKHHSKIALIPLLSLLLIVLIVVLAYFGPPRLSDQLPDRCNFGTELECSDFRVQAGTGANNNLNIELKNNIGEPISVSSFAVTSEGPTPLACTPESGFTLPTSWDEGAKITFRYDCSNWADAGFSAGQSGKILVTVTYNTVKGGSGYPHQVYGEIFVTVE